MARKVKLGRARETMSVIKLADALSEMIGESRPRCREILKALEIIVAINIHKYDSVVVIPEVVRLDRYCKMPTGYGHTDESLQWKKRDISISAKIDPYFLKRFEETAEVLKFGDYPLTIKNIGIMKSLSFEQIQAMQLTSAKMRIQKAAESSGLSKEEYLKAILSDETEGEKLWEVIKKTEKA